MSFFLLFSNIGLAINIHYCGSAIEKVSLGFPLKEMIDHCLSHQSEETQCCGNNLPTTNVRSSKKCCTDASLKQSADQLVVKTIKVHCDVFVPLVFESPFLTQYPAIKEVKAEEVAFYCESNAPPLYKLYHQYLLYA